MNQQFKHKDRYNDNFSNNNLEVGSRNRMHIVGSSPALTMAVGFVIALIIAIVIYLAIVAAWLLKVLIYAAVGIGSAWFLWTALNSIIRTGAKTFAVVTYYLAQRKRNKVLHDGPGLVVLEDPYEQLRTVNSRAIQVQRRYDNQGGAGMSAIPAAAAGSEQKDIDFENIIKWHGGSQPHEDYEYDAEEGEYYEAHEE